MHPSITIIPETHPPLIRTDHGLNSEIRRSSDIMRWSINWPFTAVENRIGIFSECLIPGGYNGSSRLGAI